MDAIDALRLAIQHYPGGIDALAVRMGKAASTLQKELRDAPGFKLGARDALAIAAMCTEVGTAHAAAYATTVATVCELRVSRREPADATVADVIANTGEVLREVGEYAQSNVLAISDGNVSDTDLHRSEREGFEAIDAIQRGMAAMRRANLASKTAAGFAPLGAE